MDALGIYNIYENFTIVLCDIKVLKYHNISINHSTLFEFAVTKKENTTQVDSDQLIHVTDDND